MNRVTPFTDLFQLVQNLTPSLWEDTIKRTDATFLLHFCHMRMEHRYGFSPFSLVSLPEIKWWSKRAVKRAAIRATTPREAYWSVLLTVKRPMIKLLRALFPPTEILEPPMRNANKNDSAIKLYARHLKRTIKQLSGFTNKPEGQEYFRQ